MNRGVWGSNGAWSRVIALACVAFLSCQSSSQAGSIVLGASGWEAVWDNSLDVSIIVDHEKSDAVFIEKAAVFTQPLGPGGFPPIPILFRQISPNAVSQIVIVDEILVNETGTPWTDFHMVLMGPGRAEFNAQLTAASGGGNGFITSPLSNQMFSDDLREFWVDGFGLGPNGSDARIPDGSVWFPGVAGGELYIDVFPTQQAPFTVFTLKEIPTPEPGTALLVILGGSMLMRRRRQIQ